MSGNPQGSSSRRQAGFGHGFRQPQLPVRSIMRRRLVCWMLLPVVAAALQCCTVVHIQTADGATTVSRRVGFVSIQPGAATTVIDVRSVGLHVAAGTASLGYGHATLLTAAPGSCEVLLLSATPATAKEFRDLLGANVSVCAPESLHARSE